MRHEMQKRIYSFVVVGIITLYLLIGAIIEGKKQEKELIFSSLKIADATENNKKQEESPIPMGQNFLRIGDQLIGSLIRDLEDHNYYMGIQEKDGTIHSIGSRTECSNLVLYKSALYFINASFLSRWQNLWYEGSDQGRIIKIDSNIKEVAISEENMLTGKEELTNCFYIWENRIYYQVTEAYGKKGTYYRVYSKNLNGQDKKEICGGVNWTADFVMDGGYLYVAEESTGVFCYDVKSKEKTCILQSDTMNVLFEKDYEIQTIVVDGQQLLFDIILDGVPHTYGMQLNSDFIRENQENSWMLQGNQLTGILYEIKTLILKENDDSEKYMYNSGAYMDIVIGTEKLTNEVYNSTTKIKNLQRDGDNLYVSQDGIIYKISIKYLNSGIKTLEKVGIEEHREKTWVIEEDGTNTPIGYNLQSLNRWTEGNGYIYAADTNIYSGKSVEKGIGDGPYLYCLKGERWEIFSFHPFTEGKIGGESLFDKSQRYYKAFIRTPHYYDGYIYYTLVLDSMVEGDSQQECIYRIPENGGGAEELAICNNKFYIYKNKIYYEYLGKHWEMELDGNSKKMIYYNENKPNIESYTVGGGFMYLWEEGGSILGVNLTTGEKRYFKSTSNVQSIFYEKEYLYIWDGTDKILRQNVRTEQIETILEDVLGETFWVQDGNIYYTDWKDGQEKKSTVMFKVMNLNTREIVSYELPKSSDKDRPWEEIHLEVMNGDIVIRMSTSYEYKGNDESNEVKYLKQKTDKIWANEPKEQ